MADNVTAAGDREEAPPTTTAPEKSGEHASNIERVVSADDDLQKDGMDYGRVDNEVAKYADVAAIELSPEEDKRLKKLIDRRVLVVMILTYFLQAGLSCTIVGQHTDPSQAIDKGTMSFASIMGILDLPGVENNVGQVACCSPSKSDLFEVCVAHDVYIPGHYPCRVSTELDHT